jgi:RNA polymerase sigma-70 factor (ECF subfamily)
MEQVPDLTDEDLMAAYCNGSEEAFSHLYGRYRERLFSFLSLRLGSGKNHLVDELFQKTWLKVHLSRNSFNRSKRFSAWIFTIALNSLRDEVGLAVEKSNHKLIDESELASEAPTAEELFSSKEQMNRISGALQKLHTNQREAILLVDAEGFTSKEASKMLQVSDATLRQMLSRGRRSLKDLFLSEEEFQ